MGDAPSTIPPLTADNFAARMADIFPPGWSSPDAKSPGGVLYGIFKMMGSGLSSLNGAAQYAMDATRIQNAQNGALDLASLDYFGSGLYAEPRKPGASDDLFRLQLSPWPVGSMLQPRATRAAVSAAVESVTGVVPRIIEPWSPADTGAWGHFYWDVDTRTTPFRWTGSGIPSDYNLAYQGFVECPLPTPALLGGQAVPCFDSNFYWEVAGSSLIDLDPSVTLGPQVVYNEINQTKCEGTIVWVKFVPAATVASWDQPGVDWDTGGVTWG